jgi:hypothetical protein
MAWTQSKIKQVRSRLLAGRIIDILGKRDLLRKVIHIGREDWNGKKVMVNKLTELSPEEQAELEEEIADQIKSVFGL